MGPAELQSHGNWMVMIFQMDIRKPGEFFSRFFCVRIVFAALCQVMIYLCDLEEDAPKFESIVHESVILTDALKAVILYFQC